MEIDDEDDGDGVIIHVKGVIVSDLNGEVSSTDTDASEIESVNNNAMPSHVTNSDSEIDFSAQKKKRKGTIAFDELEEYLLSNIF